MCSYPTRDHGDGDGKGILEGTGFLTLHLLSEAVHIIGLIGVPDSIGSHSRELILVAIATFPGSVDGVSVGKSRLECDSRNRGDPQSHCFCSLRLQRRRQRHKTTSVQVCSACWLPLRSQCCPRVWLPLLPSALGTKHSLPEGTFHVKDQNLVGFANHRPL